jgi:hypothetical protein
MVIMLKLMIMIYYLIQETEIDSFNTFLFTYKVEINVVENLLIH